MLRNHQQWRAHMPPKRIFGPNFERRAGPKTNVAYGFRKWRGWRGKAYFTTGMTGTSLFHVGEKLILWWWEAYSWWENLDFLLNLCYKCWWILKRKIIYCGACRENNQAFSWTFNGLVKIVFSWNDWWLYLFKFVTTYVTQVVLKTFYSFEKCCTNLKKVNNF